MGKASDLVHGRQGGRLKSGPVPPKGKPCELCGQLMAAGQKRRHFACCSEQADPPRVLCGQGVPDDETKRTVCSFCWRAAA